MSDYTDVLKPVLLSEEDVACLILGLGAIAGFAMRLGEEPILKNATVIRLVNRLAGYEVYAPLPAEAQEQKP